MKIITGLAMILSLFLVSFSPLNIDQVATAIRTGDANQLASYMDNQVDITLPGKSDTYSKIQAGMIIRDFFNRNGVRNFQIKQKGENDGAPYLIGILQTFNGDFRTTLFMKQKGDKELLQELRFQQVP
jgi:hypothetical protein